MADEATNFPAGKFKDQVDALSGAYGLLIGASVFKAPEDEIAISSSIRISWLGNKRAARLTRPSGRLGR